MTEATDTDLVEVWSYPRISLAKVGQYKLESSGVEAKIFGGDVDSYYLTAIGGVSLMVRKVDYDLAKRILNSKDDIDEEIVLEKDEIGEGIEYCLSCHSKNIRTKVIHHFKTDFLFLDFLKRRFGYKQVHFCRNCKQIWKTR